MDETGGHWALGNMPVVGLAYFPQHTHSGVCPLHNHEDLNLILHTHINTRRGGCMLVILEMEKQSQADPLGLLACQLILLGWFQASNSVSREQGKCPPTGHHPGWGSRGLVQGTPLSKTPVAIGHFPEGIKYPLGS